LNHSELINFSAVKNKFLEFRPDPTRRHSWGKCLLSAEVRKCVSSTSRV